MRLFRAAAAIALVLASPAIAAAGDPPRRTVDKNIEKAAARKAAEKLGELRGLIFEDITVDYLATGKIGADIQKSPRALAPAAAGSGKSRKLPPVVHNDRESHGIDPFATRSIEPAGHARVSMILAAPVRAGPNERLSTRLPMF